jgi:hypothetical protein
MSTPSLLFLVALLSIAVALAASNPTMQDYDAFLEATVTQAVERRLQQAPAQGAMIRNLVRALLKPVLQSVVRPNTVRHNYGLFSVFETQALESRVVVLGIGNHFLPVRGVEEVVQKLERLARKPSPSAVPE